MPASAVDVGAWIAEEALSHTPGTIGRRLASLKAAHDLARMPSPTADPELRHVLGGIRRTYGVAPHQKSPITLDGLLEAVRGCGDDLAGLRDRAILCVAWAGALRRSEVAALAVEDVLTEEVGIILVIRRSKTDQEGTGQRVALPHAQTRNDAVCPPCRLRDWLEAAGISDGPLFRRINHGRIGNPLSGQAIGFVVQRRMRGTGFEGNWGGHSLRAGFVTQAARSGVDVLVIASQTRHRRLDQVRNYYRIANPWDKNAATEAGL